MYLQRLELIGFKSFAQKTVIEFSRSTSAQSGIAAIIGPNGSGKSNLGESIRWALGEQSIKSLRGKKSEDIIFSGSGLKKHLNLAEVVLFFNNEKNNNQDFPYQEFTITRRLYRNGESEYLINKNKVRLQDISLLMAKSGFGQKSYSIISQGTIQKILELSPQERQNFFNEATSVKQYQIKQEKAQKKIIKSQENLKKTAIILSEIKPLLNSLYRQIKRLEKRKEIEKELTEEQIKYYRHAWQKLHQKNEETQKKIKINQKKQKEISQELKKFQEDSKESFQKSSRENYQKTQEKYQQWLEEKNNLLSQEANLSQRINEIHNKIQNSIRTKIKEAPEINREELIDSIKNLQIIQEKIKKYITNKEKNWGQIEKWIEKSQAQIQKIIDSLQEKKPPTDSLSHNLNKKKRLEEVKKQQEEIREKITIANQKLEKFQKKIKELAHTINEKEKEIFLWQEKTSKSQKKLGEIEYQTNQLKIELARFETKEQDLEEEIKNEIKNLNQNTINLIKEKKRKDKINLSSDVSRQKIEQLKYQLEIIGGIDPEVLQEYPRVQQRYDFLKKQSSDLKISIKSLNKINQELEEKIKNQFQESFYKINQAFDRYFKIIFNGGQAKIQLKENASLEGEKEIEILATPPHKKIKNISMLSGGEKALTSLALIAAIISINEPPFVILDEVAASLDPENSAKFAKIIKELRRHTQFIVITHNQEIIEIADVLYGVSMQKNGTSKLISLRLEN